MAAAERAIVTALAEPGETDAVRPRPLDSGFKPRERQAIARRVCGGISRGR